MRYLPTLQSKPLVQEEDQTHPYLANKDDNWKQRWLHCSKCTVLSEIYMKSCIQNGFIWMIKARWFDDFRRLYIGPFVMVPVWRSQSPHPYHEGKCRFQLLSIVKGIWSRDEYFSKVYYNYKLIFVYVLMLFPIFCCLVEKNRSQIFNFLLLKWRNFCPENAYRKPPVIPIK